MIDANQRATGSGTYMENGLGGEPLERHVDL